MTDGLGSCFAGKPSSLVYIQLSILSSVATRSILVPCVLSRLVLGVLTMDDRDTYVGSLVVLREERVLGFFLVDKWRQS